MVGKQLVSKLLAKGHKVSILSRKPLQLENVAVFQWDVNKQTIDPKAMTGIDTVINLTGEGIADKPWTTERKQQIIDSRVKSTELLFKAIKENGTDVKSYISASAVGIYGNRGDEILTEESRN